MNNTTAIDPAADDASTDASTHEALVDNYISDIKRIHEQMNDDRQEILTLQEETRAILDNVMATLKAA